MKEYSAEKNRILYYSTLFVKQVDWLWEPYIPYGKITVVQGDPGDGKTTLILNIAALLSKGLPMPDSHAGTQCGTVLYQSAEDVAEDTIKPRLIAAGADCTNIAFIDETEHRLTLTSPRLESAIRETNAKMLVIDPLQAYLDDSSGLNSADGVRPSMKALASIAERTGCAIVIIGHMNKSNGSKGIYRGLGSIDITAAARSVLLVGRLRDNAAIRVVAQLKNSLAPEGSSMAFEINSDASVRWIGEYEITAEELLTGNSDSTENSKAESAANKLKLMLTDGDMPCSDIYGRFRIDGISKRTVDTAKKQLQIKSIKKSDGWYWSL